MGRVKKGYRASQWTVGIWGIFITLLFVCVPRPIANIFFHEPKAIATAVDYLIIVGFSEAFLCIETTTVGALSGLGRTHLCSVISIIFTSARIPLAIILGGTSLGLNGIWWALSSTSIVKGVLFVIVFQWVTRTKKTGGCLTEKQIQNVRTESAETWGLRYSGRQKGYSPCNV